MVLWRDWRLWSIRVVIEKVENFKMGEIEIARSLDARPAARLVEAAAIE
jgi:hypothetical protein